MPQSQSIPPGKGGKPHGKKSKSFELNIVWLNRTHCFFIFKITGKIFNFQKFVFGKFPVNHADFTFFTPESHESRKIHTIY